MKRIPLIILLVSLFAVGGMSQTQPSLDAVNSFWKAAQKNDLDGAGKQVADLFYGEEKLKRDVQFISESSFGELKPVSQQFKSREPYRRTENPARFLAEPFRRDAAPSNF